MASVNTLGAQTFVGINFCVWRFLDLTIFDDFWNFGEFKIREMHAAPKEKKTPIVIIVVDDD